MTDDLSKIWFAKPLGTIFNGYYEHEQLMEDLIHYLMIQSPSGSHSKMLIVVRPLISLTP